MMISTVVVAVMALANGVNAFWRMECQGRVGIARIDPLINPGALASHVHVLHGSNGFSDTSKYDDLRRGTCSSCRLPQDLSAYWSPSLYFQDKTTQKYELVEQVGGMLAYYFIRDENTVAFQPGFNMIAGDNKRRTYTAGDMYKPDPEQSIWAALGETTQDRLTQRAIGFNCLNYNAQPEGTLFRHYMPSKDMLDKNCTDGLRAELMFPMCWDGKTLSSPDHKSHVAYPDLVMNGNCPSSHPVRLPGLLFETIWATNAYKNRNGRFVWSNGDTTGLGYHGDFVTGWDPNFLQEALNTCTNLSGRLEDCPLFVPTLQSEAKARQCTLPKLPTQISDEDVIGPRIGLPGDVPVLPEGSTFISATATLSYTPGPKATDGQFLPGEVFREVSTTSSSKSTTRGSSTSSPSSNPEPAATSTSPALADVIPTTTPAVTVAAVPSKSKGIIFSTEFVTRSNVVSEIFWEEAVVYVTQTQDQTTTVTVTAGKTPAKMRRAIRHPRHIHGHH